MNKRYNLNEEQMKCVNYNGNKNAVLVLAGAGSGKTTVISNRIKFLVDSKNISPSKILMLSFTNRGVKEMDKRIKKFGVEAKTFHAFARHILSIKYQKEFGMLDYEFPFNTNIVMREAIKKYKDEYCARTLVKPPPLPLPASKHIISYNSYLINTCGLSPKDDKYHSNKIHIDKIISIYKDIKKTKKVVDIDDLVSLLIEKIENNKHIQNILKNEYTHVIVDEMQDTSPLQIQLLNFFYKNNVNLFCVGDPAQSIFSFIGADYKNILKFSENFNNAEQFLLKNNYRSTPEILKLSNQILKQSQENYCSDFLAMSDSCNKKPMIFKFDNKLLQFKYIQSDIENKRRKNYCFSDMAIICRTKKDLFFTQAHFIGNNMSFASDHKIENQKLIVDLIFLINFIKNDTFQLNKHQKHLVEYLNVDALRKKFKICYSCSDLSGILQNELIPHLEKKYGQEWEEESACLEAFNYLITFYGEIDEFLKLFENKKLTSQFSKNTVFISTVHGIKGAEYKVCYVINVDNATYPHYKNREDKDLIEEDRRILYVALTRAMKELIITHYSHKNGYLTDFLSFVDSSFVDFDDSQLIPKSSLL